MVYLWNVFDLGVLIVVENEMEVEFFVYLFYLKMEKMVFFKSNGKI